MKKVIKKIKKFLSKNSKMVKRILLIVLIFIIFLLLYKVFFYSSREKDIYGVRLKDIKEYKISDKNLKEFEDNLKKSEGVSDARIKIKGRLIKYFVTFDSGVTTDKMKEIFNKSLEVYTDKEKSYYDYEFYSIVEKDEKDTYPMIGYKNKNKNAITWDVF